MGLAGALSKTNLIQILNLIRLAKKTGQLIITDSNETHRAQIGFKNGEINYAATPENPQDLLSIIQKYGVLNDRQLQTLQKNRMGRHDKAVALMLVNANFVTKDIIHNIYKRHIIEIIYDGLGWNPYHFEFIDNLLSPDETIHIACALDGIIEKAKMQQAEVAFLHEIIPDIDRPLMLLNQDNQHNRLSATHWRVVGLVSHNRTIRDIAKTCQLTETEIRRLILDLQKANLVRYE